MQLFRKKPVTINAIRWTGKNLREVLAFVGQPLTPPSLYTWEQYELVLATDGLKIATLEGVMKATVGDWIIKGVKGEFYPCKPDIFDATYEAADSPAKLERIFELYPAYDKRNDDPKKKYGTHGVEMKWVVRGPLGAVQFLLFTGWMLDHVEQEMQQREFNHPVEFKITRPMPADLGYHSPVPRFEDQKAMPCNLLPEGTCFYDGSSLNAERPFKILKEKGLEELWLFLENYYHTTLKIEPEKLQ